MIEYFIKGLDECYALLGECNYSTFCYNMEDYDKQ